MINIVLALVMAGFAGYAGYKIGIDIGYDDGYQRGYEDITTGGEHKEVVKRLIERDKISNYD